MLTDDIFLINERGPDFWGTHKISPDSRYAHLDERGEKILSRSEFERVLEGLKGKKVLVYIHGLRTTKEDVLKSHSHMIEHISKHSLNLPFYSRLKSLIKYYTGYSKHEAYSNHRPYDAIIGYTWPSYESEAYYYNAKKKAKRLAPRLAKHLHDLSEKAKKVDVLAHSMGNLLLFEALSKYSSEKTRIDHIYSVAAAVPADSLHPNNPYQRVLNFCKNLFVFHSGHDYALGWPYYLAEGTTLALGLVGSQKVASKLKVIDSSEAVKGHSDYLSSKEFYSYLLKIHNQELNLDESYFKM